MRNLAVLFAAALALSTLPAPSAAATEIAGVTFEESVSAGGSALVLNGVALRKKWFVKVYTIGLYVPAKTSSASGVLGQDGPRLARMVMMLGLEGSKIADTIGEAFEKNPANDMSALGERLDSFKALFRASEKGDVIDLAYAPGVGTSITHSGKALGTVPGKDFADALFGVWIGSASVDDDLSDALMGK